LIGIGSLIWLTGHTDCHECGNCEYRQTFQHDGEKVSRQAIDAAQNQVRRLL
jgi:hypothetical protein